MLKIKSKTQTLKKSICRTYSNCIKRCKLLKDLVEKELFFKSKVIYRYTIHVLHILMLLQLIYIAVIDSRCKIQVLTKLLIIKRETNSYSFHLDNGVDFIFIGFTSSEYWYL